MSVESYAKANAQRQMSGILLCEPHFRCTLDLHRFDPDGKMAKRLNERKERKSRPNWANFSFSDFLFVLFVLECVWGAADFGTAGYKSAPASHKFSSHVSTGPWPQQLATDTLQELSLKKICQIYRKRSEKYKKYSKYSHVRRVPIVGSSWSRSALLSPVF